MSDYRGDGPYTTDHGARRVDVGPAHHERKRGGAGRWLLILLAIAAIIAAVLFATGFWRADTSGELRAPDIDVSVKGGSVPDVDVDSKALEVTTEKEVIEVPKLEVTKGETDKDGPDNN